MNLHISLSSMDILTIFILPKHENEIYVFWAPLMAQIVKNMPAMQEAWVQSLGCKDLLEKGMATHSSILARRTPWTEEPDRLQYTGW